ncbi:MAG: MBL fold metallo-hydrolase [Lachnospiraceae bacterium]|nr:MBL fold metallo-hydrolase [Lachnospiraceae bacterium]
MELQQNILIFDYYGEGKLPQFPQEKKVWFLNSHSHSDHFKREILDLKENYPNAEYILSRDIRFGKEKPPEWIHRVRAQQVYQIGDLSIQTLRSTDVGVAFVIETEGKRIYHGGDLNWWHWESESKAWNNNMAANYKKFIGAIEGQSFDLVFVPLDPRLGMAYDWGMKYFLEHTKAEVVFPMHCWEDYTVCEKLQKQPWMEGLLKHFVPIQYAGQEWDLC